jgi:hypothetical protein
MATTPEEKQNWTEQIKSGASGLRDRAEDLIEEGNERRVTVHNDRGDVLMDVPLNPTVIIVGVVALINPVIAVLAVLASLLAHLKIEVVRREAHADE